MYKLVIQDDEGKTTVVPLIRDEITIGRKEGNTIRLTERNVSRKHARIVRSNGTVAIEDLGSYNGVRVNGTRISQRTPLTVSDRVQIGDYLIELKAEGAEQAAGAPASYEDAKTQPVERIDPNYANRTPTVPLPGGMPPPHPSAGTMPTPPAGMATAQPGMPMVGDPASTLVALSDTDPRMAAVPRAAAVAPMAPTSGHARLVILSSNFAGREFELSKPQTVIGRTDDNDVVVNHRSISRNHAKVVREPETGRYTIMDLQSSNGVRVNGEEYGKVELRRGDIVDLGHVRMRFVDVGEDFVFGRDAQAVDVPTGGGKGLFIALGALLLIGGIVGVVMATSGGDDKKDTAGPVANEPGKTAPDAGTPGPGPGPDVKTTGKQLNELKLELQQAVDSEKWADIPRICDEIVKLAPDDPECPAKIAQAKREMDAQLKYDDFKKAVVGKDYPAVAQTFREIDGDSLYKEKARPDHDRTRDTYVDGVRGQAQRFAKAGKCKDIDKLAANSEKVWPEAGGAAREEAARCSDVVAVGPDKKDEKKDIKKDDKKDEKKDDKKDDKKDEVDSGKTAEELAADASAAARNGQYGKALRVAEDALRKDSKNIDALTAAAIASCNLKKAELAKKYIAKLGGSRQGMVRQICLRNNVNVD